MTRRSFVLAAACLGLVLGPLRPASAVVLPDSTAADAWRLANGLEVRVRHIPGAAGVVITTGYRSGLLDDPKGRLQGSGAQVRFLRYETPDEVDEALVREFVRKAIAHQAR